MEMMSVQVQTHQTGAIQLFRRVRQGDVISPKLFTNAMEGVFKTLQWDGLGINVNGDLTHLRFADDIVLMADSLQDLQKMLSSLNAAPRRVGLGMNLDKTKVMFNRHIIPVPISIQGVALYISLEECSLGGQCLGSCVISLSYPCHNASKPRYSISAFYVTAITYGAETWNLTVGLAVNVRNLANGQSPKRDYHVEDQSDRHSLEL